MMSEQVLSRSTPEAQGIASAAISDFLDAVEQDGQELHGLMVMRHGQVLAEGWWIPYAAEVPHIMYSLSKSFTSTAAGLAIAEGLFSLDDTVISFFPNDLPETVHENMATMRVQNLLSMATGHAKDVTDALWESEDGNWVQAFLETTVENAPGAPFVYNSAATYMVAAIVEKVTGMGLLAYLEPRLLAPLGITGATWETCPRGIATGGWGLNIKTEDIARFGQLYLQKGVWNGKRLLSEEWVEMATSAQVSNGDPTTGSDWSQGYGFQFWRSRHGAYRGDGAFGQYCIVMPEQDAVVAITSGSTNMQAVLNRVWEHLLLKMQPAALAENEMAQGLLSLKMASLTLHAPQGYSDSPIAATVSGQTYTFPANDQGISSVRYDFGAGTFTITINDAAGEHTFQGGIGKWERGSTTFQPLARSLQPTAVYGVWIADDTFTARLCYSETPFHPTLTCRFYEDRLLFDLKGNIGFGPSERPQLEGHKA
jgi:CubicO group peptidase (beta-lactamase class C family)